MPKNASYLKILTVLYLCVLLVPITALAQTPTPTQPKSGIYINDVRDPVEIDGPGGFKQLTVEVIFTLLDANKNVRQDAEPETGSIVVDVSGFEAGVQKMEQPGWNVVLLVDTSKTVGTIQGAATLKTIRSVITSSISPGGNQNMKILVIKFDESFTDVTQSFTQSPEDFSKAINGLRGVTSGNSCLHDAAMNALGKLIPAPGRRALVIVTASQDNCGKSTAQQVTALADQNHIQIYAVGVQGYPITQQNLDDLTLSTGGLGFLSPESSLGFAVSNVSGILASQFLATANLCPPQQGPTTGTLDITLSNGSQLSSDPFSFVSPQPYTCPPEIKLKGVVRPKTYGIDFNLDMTSPDLINALQVTIVDKETGLEVSNQTLNSGQFGLQNEVEVGNLEEGKGYQLAVTALSSTGVPLSSDGQEFNWVPSKPIIQVSIAKTPTLQESAWTVEVEPAAPQGAVKFQVFLAVAQAQQLDEDPEPVSEIRTVAVGEKITMPADDKLPAGEYVIVVRALNANDQAVASGVSPKTPWNPFTWMQRVIAFVNQPIGWVVIAGVCCGSVFGLLALVWLVVPKPGTQPKPVDLVVPEKRQRAAPVGDSGYFEPPPPPVAPPPRPSRPEPVPQQVVSAPPAPSPAPPTANLPKAFLSAHSPVGVIPQVQITRVPLTIGRRVGNDIVLNVDNSMGVSGQHAKITFSNGRFFVLDEGSTYGTTLNGQTIPKGMPSPLDDGAVLGFGPKVKLQFRLDRSG